MHIHNEIIVKTRSDEIGRVQGGMAVDQAPSLYHPSSNDNALKIVKDQERLVT